MTLEILSIVGGNSGGGKEPPGGPNDGGSMSGAGKVSGVGPGAGFAGSVGGGTDTNYAVQPTPLTANAAKVDLSGEKSSGEAVFEYPVSGPDKFARAVAEVAQAEARAEQIAAEAKETPEGEEIDIDVEQPRGAEDVKAADAAAAPDGDDGSAQRTTDAEPAKESTETSVFVQTPDDGNE